MRKDAIQPDSQPELTGMLKVLRDAKGPAPRPYYQSYLLRVWREQPTGIWRVSLENVTSGEKHGFAHLEQLVAFLENGEVAPHERQAAIDSSLLSNNSESQTTSHNQEPDSGSL
jgi:hypothetical protein